MTASHSEFATMRERAAASRAAKYGFAVTIPNVPSCTSSSVRLNATATAPRPSTPSALAMITVETTLRTIAAPFAPSMSSTSVRRRLGSAPPSIIVPSAVTRSDGGRRRRYRPAACAASAASSRPPTASRRTRTSSRRCATPWCIAVRTTEEPGPTRRHASRSRTGGSRSSTSRRPATTRCRTRTARSGSPTTARSTTTLTLRAELEAKGHVYRSHTDTETILHLYEEEGPRCVERLDGMFAFAIWDSRRRELFLARDRLGIKPLYYAQPAGGFVFALGDQGAARAPGHHAGSRRGGVLPLPDVRLHAGAADDVQGHPQAGAGRADDRARGRVDPAARHVLDAAVGPRGRRGGGDGRGPARGAAASSCSAARSTSA